MKLTSALLGVTAVSLLSLTSTQAASVVFNVPSGDWATPANWNNGYVPGASPGVDPDNAFVRGGRTATITTNVNAGLKPISLLHIAEESTLSTVAVGTGGSLTVTTLNVMRPGASLSGARGAFTMTGGSYNGTTTNIGVGNASQSGSGNGTMSISGASTVSAGATNIGSVASAANGTGNLNITGSQATFAGTTLTANAFSEIKFTLDAASVTTLSFSGLANFATGAKLTLDGSSYTGGAAVITLIDAGSLTGFAGIAQSITGFNPGYTTSITFDSGSNNILLNISGVPEPSTYALLGLGLGAVLWRARRLRKS